MLSAAVGCAFRVALGDVQWVAAPLAMATSLLVMQWTRTVHPPGELCDKHKKQCQAAVWPWVLQW